MEKETLKEAAEKLIFATISGKYGLSSINEHDQVDGYFETYLEAFLTLKLKWQKEQDKKMYSEEDMKCAYMEGGNDETKYKTFYEWFNEFKNK
jgi:hypothetical protein